MNGLIRIFVICFMLLSAVHAQTHPRLFFDTAELTQIRAKLDREPFKTMLATLEATKSHGDFYRATNVASGDSLLMRASAHAMLYSLTGLEQHAVDCKADVVTALGIIDATGNWANSALKGLTSYSYANRLSICYDLCYHATSWDSNFKSDISTRLRNIATMIINHGGTEQNTQASSNWQCNRAASGGMALLATDESYDDALMVSAISRLNSFFSSNQGSNTRGWNPEGTGYTAYLYGSFVGPFAIALDRLQPSRSVSNQSGMKWMPWTAFAGAVPAAANTAYNVYGLGGVKTDWSDDNAHIGGEGLYGLAFRFSHPSLLPGLRYAYDRLQGSLAPDGGRWDAARHGIFWSILFYPEDTPAQDPLEIFDWQEANGIPSGLGLVTFRDGFRGENDILVHFKARTKVVDSNSHDGADGLGFRILGPNAPFVLGGGRDNPGRDRNQATVYPNTPNNSPISNKNTGTYHGLPLIKPDGGGHAIASMVTNNVGTTSHKRWIITDFERAATGADATVIVADTTGNGRFWQLPTYLDNTLTVTGNMFTITGQNGATLQGTVIHPGGNPVITVGTKARGQAYTLQNGGTLATESTSNPRILNNRYLFIENTTDHDFLVVMTIQKNGGRHPIVNRTGGSVADATLTVGNRSYGLQNETVLYDGAPFVQPNAIINFAAGPNGSVTGSTVQIVAHGAAASAPTATPNSGFSFAGWDKSFDKVARSMTVTARFAPSASTASILALATSSWRADENSGNVNIGVTRTGSLSGAIGVSYATSDGSAVSGLDYQSTSGNLSWADGDGSTKMITVPLLNDSVMESDETLMLHLSNPTGGAILTVPIASTITLVDDEVLAPLPVLAFQQQSISVSEDAGAITIDVNRNVENTGAIGVSYQTMAGSASAGVDFTAASGTLAWAAGTGGVKSFTIPILDDLLVEGNETFTIVLSNATGGAIIGSPAIITVTILENEVNLAPTIVVDRPTGGFGATGTLTQGIQLATTVTDDGLPGPLTYLWEKISGPGTVVFGNSLAEDTWATFSLSGVYQLRLTAHDGLLSDSETIVVNAAAAGSTLQRLAEFPFTHAANSPTPLTATVVGNNMSVTPVSRVGSIAADSAANQLRVEESGGTGGISANFSDATDHVWFRLDADPGYYFDLTSASAPRIQFEMARNFAPSGVNIVGRIKLWAAAASTATISSPLVYTSPEITATGSTLVAMNDTTGIVGVSAAQRYRSLLFQVQWKGTASGTSAKINLDNFIVNGAVVAEVNNVGPLTQAGADSSVQMGAPFPLNGSAEDDGLPTNPGALSFQWQKLNGPGNVSFSAPTNPTSNASFDAPGNYTLLLTADDGETATSDTVTIQVSSSTPQAPVAPSGLNAAAIAFNRIDLTWSDQSNDETAFKIFRSANSGSGFVEIGSTAANATSFSDTSVAAASSYFYQIRATSANGESAASNESTATTPAAPPASSGAIRLSAPTYQLIENAGQLVINVQRSDGVDGEVSIDYSTAGLTANAGVDFSSASGTLTWVNGDNVDKQIVIILLDDAVYEGNETFSLTLTNPSGGATLGQPATAVVTILENEINSAPVISVSSPQNATAATNHVTDRLWLDTIVSDDGQPGPLTLVWSKLSGPGSVTFGDAGAEDTWASFTLAGNYVIQLQASDGLLTATSTVAVQVAAAGGGSTGVIPLADYPFTHASGVLPTGWNSSQLTVPDLTASDVTIQGATFANNTANLLRFTDTATTSFSATSNYLAFTLSASGGKHFDFTDPTCSISFQIDRISGDTPQQAQVQIFAGNNATGALLFTSNFASSTGSLETLTYTGPIAAINHSNAYTHLYVQVQWRSGAATPASSAWSLDNFKVSGALVGGAGNLGPVSHAGADTTSEIGASITLAGFATDDGQPSIPGVLSFQWRLLNGPGNVIFSNAEQSVTQAIFDSPGLYELAMITDDGAIATADVLMVNVTPEFSPIDAWRLSHFGATANSGNGANAHDFDGDGLSNLLEYGLGTDPTTANVSPAAQIEEIAGERYLQIEWTRPENRTDIITIGEISSDLTAMSWSSHENDVITTINAAADGFETITIRDSMPMQAHERRFLRARIQSTSP